MLNKCCQKNVIMHPCNNSVLLNVVRHFFFFFDIFCNNACVKYMCTIKVYKYNGHIENQVEHLSTPDVELSKNK